MNNKYIIRVKLVSRIENDLNYIKYRFQIVYYTRVTLADYDPTNNLYLYILSIYVENT